MPPTTDTTGPERDRLRRGLGRAFGVLLADAARDDGRRADAEPHRHRVDDGQHRLGHADRGHRSAPTRDTKNTSTTAKSDSMPISRTMGTASMIKAGPTGPVV